MRQSLFMLLLMSAISGATLAQTGNTGNLPQGQYQLTGTIQAIDKTSRIVTVDQVAYPLAASVVISDKSGKRYNFSALEKGMQVNIFVDNRERTLPRDAVKQLQIIIN